MGRGNRWELQAGRIHRKGFRRLGILLAGILLAGVLFGCGSGDGEGTRIVFTTGPASDEVFLIEGEACTLPEFMLYLTNVQNQYESVYGEEIWQTSYQQVTLEENVKDTVLASIAQIKSMYLLAKSMDVTLTEDEESKVQEAAAAYFASLNETEIELLDVTEDLIYTIYEQYTLAWKVYEEIVADVNPEISDDDARIITVQHILIKTYYLDGDEKIAYDEEEKQEAYETACEVRDLAVSGSYDFETLAGQYSDDDTITYSFGKGEMEEAFETAAFNLETDEISQVVETSEGYHIIKCITTYDREQTDANKLVLVANSKKEAFNEVYDAFVETLSRQLNESLWDEISLLHDDAVTTEDLFKIYEEYFPEEE